jgi:hypothetical protein
MFLGDKAKIAGKVTSGTESSEVANKPDQGRRREKANSWYRDKTLNSRDLLGEGVELMLHFLHLSLQLEDLQASLAQTDSQSVGQPRLGIFDKTLDSGHDMARTLRNKYAELS